MGVCNSRHTDNYADYASRFKCLTGKCNYNNNTNNNDIRLTFHDIINLSAPFLQAYQCQVSSDLKMKAK